MRGLSIAHIGVHDISVDYAQSFARHLAETVPEAQSRVYTTAEELIRASDLVVFASTAARPHVTGLAPLAHNPLVLHVSLRDLAPELILAGINVVDHVLQADTSIHLAEQLSGRRDFIAATLCDTINGWFEPEPERPLFFSPFGLGPWI